MCVVLLLRFDDNHVDGAMGSDREMASGRMHTTALLRDLGKAIIFAGDAEC